jgi:hypothetical protein
MHLVPVDAANHGPDAVCLSNADALAQMANPAFWLHYAGFVRGLGFSEGRDWYRAMLLDRQSRLSPLAAPLAQPLLDRALEICDDIPQHSQTGLREGGGGGLGTDQAVRRAGDRSKLARWIPPT